MRIAKIIVGQPGAAITDHLGSVFQRDDFDVHLASQGNQVLDLLRGEPMPDILVLDRSLRNPGVVDICRLVRSDPRLSMIPIILYVSEVDMNEDHHHFIQSGCYDVLVQPSPATFLARLQSLLRLKYVSEGL